MTDRALNAPLETVRIPLGAADESRIQSARVSGGFTSTATFDQCYINCFPAAYKDPLRNDTTVHKLVSRYGLAAPLRATFTTALTNPSTTVPVAVMSSLMLPDRILIAYDDSTAGDILIYELEVGGEVQDLVTTITGFSGANVWFTEVNVNNVANVAIVVDDGTVSEAWNVASAAGTFVGGTVAQYTGGGNFPTETPALRLIGPMLQMNSYVFALASDGYIYNCELSGGAPDLATWNVLGKLEVSSQPDGPVRMIRYKHHILVLGSSSIEFFNFDEGITPPASPLAATNQAFINFGCISTNAVTAIDDTLYWVAQSKEGALGLWRLDGYSPVLLTANFMSTYLWEQSGDFNFQIVQMHGMRHIVTNAVTNSGYGYIPEVQDTYAPTNQSLIGTVCYCIETGVWWIWAFEDAATVGYEILVTQNMYTNYQYYFPVSTYGLTPNKLYPLLHRFEQTVGYDAFNVEDEATIQYFRIPVGFFSNVYDFETTNRKTIHRLKLAGDVLWDSRPNLAGVLYFAGETMTLYILSAWTETAQYNPSNWAIREIPIVSPADAGSIYEYPNYPEYRLNNFGTARKWKFGFIGNFWTPLRFDAFEITIRKGNH